MKFTFHHQLLQGVLMTQTQLASSRKIEGQDEEELVDPVLDLCLEIFRRLQSNSTKKPQLKNIQSNTPTR